MTRPAKRRPPVKKAVEPTPPPMPAALDSLPQPSTPTIPIPPHNPANAQTVHSSTSATRMFFTPVPNGLKIGGQVLLVKVGPVPMEFHVYEDLICASSGFFKTMMVSGMEESKTRIVKLPEDDPELFGAYHQFLYTKRLLRPLRENEPEIKMSGQKFETLVDAYVLGDRLQDEAFKDCVIDGFCGALRTPCEGKVYYPHHTTITYIYDNTLPKSPLRSLAVNQYVRLCTFTWFSSTTAEGFPAQFLHDLAAELYKYRIAAAGILSNATESCQHHSHEKVGGKCYKTELEKK